MLGCEHTTHVYLNVENRPAVLYFAINLGITKKVPPHLCVRMRFCVCMCVRCILASCKRCQLHLCVCVCVCVCVCAAFQHYAKRVHTAFACVCVCPASRHHAKKMPTAFVCVCAWMPVCVFCIAALRKRCILHLYVRVRGCLYACSA